MWLFRRAGRYALYDVVWDIRESILKLHRKLDVLMTSESDLQGDLDAIKTSVAAVSAKISAQSDTIASLQAQIAAGTPVSQAQLDALKTEADGIVAALTPLT